MSDVLSVEVYWSIKVAFSDKRKILLEADMAEGVLVYPKIIDGVDC